MYTFKTSGGKELKIMFKHHKKEGKAPEHTECVIFEKDPAGLVTVYSRGYSRVLSEIAHIVRPEDVSDFFNKKGSKPKRVFRTEDNMAVVIVSGDRFSYDKARKESFRKAISDADRETRRNAWNALLAGVQQNAMKAVV